jgi:uncharacterized membrane protein YvlD (DUF360 family)
MKDLVVHWIVSALLLTLVDRFVAGITIDDFGHALLAACSRCSTSSRTGC